ncbi:NifB/NifX family molybdenum-iron cluster-binding protein [Salidesulfovibrio brasiliensis]|uniref:NifB/NifX family molybdenum-iron cluster-binding protein n=1 Tax=Salidesulfovibrio brasiliensis TaxID=221711 RepID=UPI0006D22127|nr:NifB/NifX family molybdenum-iron cluster-binding protein [Salidesulfovibrio brasiliensis]
MAEKVLIPLYENEVAPRFDLATEVLVVHVDRRNDGSPRATEKVVVLSEASPEELCRIIIADGMDAVICSAIEEEYHQYLIWKKVAVFDNVLGPVDKVLSYFLEGRLESGTILYDCPL